MTPDPMMTNALDGPGQQPGHGRAGHQRLRHLGDWTTARRLDVRASRRPVVLDLLRARIEPGERVVDLDHATVKRRVPDGVVIDDRERRGVGGGWTKDGTRSTWAGRRIRRRGERPHAQVRVQRDGIAILSLPRTRSLIGDVGFAHRPGRLESVRDGNRHRRWRAAMTGGHER